MSACALRLRFALVRARIFVSSNWLCLFLREKLLKQLVKSHTRASQNIFKSFSKKLDENSMKCLSCFFHKNFKDIVQNPDFRNIPPSRNFLVDVDLGYTTYSAIYAHVTLFLIFPSPPPATSCEGIWVISADFDIFIFRFQKFLIFWKICCNEKKKKKKNF